MRILEGDGWTRMRGHGSHQIFKHPVKKGIVIVAVHASKDIPTGTLKFILKQAGLEGK
ncbi:MAG TPA: type II toxin-antitoxin system HicA family toxin [Candidatus Binataceae bacterium]|nr:type II toxin-antitoxin system HicA family toxin [Candidatus Binataceae bacterium]